MKNRTINYIRIRQHLKARWNCILCAAVAACLASHSSQAKDESSPAKVQLHDLFTSIADSEYNIEWKPELKSYQSPNRHQDLRFTYSENGFTVASNTQRQRARMARVYRTRASHPKQVCRIL